ncbi:N-acetyllactosaminide beta-1,6-N-acetylglucosaminyl-transferase-like isoform X2 [Ruditapes philippinarum]|uniref:N-acetyllactosaminide beta-1,6-N-acetylglucosaminyl-transferase-like isoform X2 n=1 Tax=Ruditapes philippinarum TaxID=129788 RepID=UPI00295B31EC|nr:N-acetyllactosaminide beta-1,6-N-acetylglucosaminyl-transferase-like isoform X2 [Ruditapes philippinarum]
MKIFFVLVSLTYSLAFGVIFSFLILSYSDDYTKKSIISNISSKYLRSRNPFETKLDKVTEVVDAMHRKHVYDSFYRPIRNSFGVNCSKLIDNDKYEIFKAKTIMSSGRNTKSNLTSDFYLNITRNCSLFRKTRGYIQHPLTEEERAFPIAFSILAYTDIEQIERLLRIIYRPHNYYCIHMDSKMSPTEKKALKMIAYCLSNVFIAGKSIDVTWGNFTLLEAELVCMETMWPFKAWKYYINLAGQEFPLKTNRQIVAILKVLNGANVVQGNRKTSNVSMQKRIGMKKTPPPYGIQITKGSMHIAANRFFVDFCLHDTRAREYLEWLKITRIPDELFFSSLNHNPHLGIPGSYIGEDGTSCLKPFFLRFVIWGNKGDGNCHGYYVRNVCVLGVEDLYRAYNGMDLFVNKFHLGYEHLALDCLEEVLYELTWKEFVDDIHIDASYYKHLHYVKMQLKSNEIYS